jgi:hypothetical protein
MGGNRWHQLILNWSVRGGGGEEEDPEMTWETVSGKGDESEESNTSESSKLASMAKSD